MCDKVSLSLEIFYITCWMDHTFPWADKLYSHFIGMSVMIFFSETRKLLKMDTFHCCALFIGSTLRKMEHL